MDKRTGSVYPARLVALITVTALLIAVLGAPREKALAAFPGGDGPIVFSAGGSIYIGGVGAGVTALTDCRAGKATNPTFNSDATKVAYDSGGVVYVTDTNSGDPTVVADGRWPAWSPNSLQLAFERDGNIYVINLDGTGESLLGPGESPAWASNGQKITFVHRSSDGASLDVMQVDGSNVTALTPPTAGLEDLAPNWAPGNDRVVFERAEVADVDADGAIEQDVFIVNSDGTNLHAVTNTPAHEADPVFSPTGSSILVSAEASGGEGTDILAMSSDGSNVVVKEDVGTTDEAPDWGYGTPQPEPTDTCKRGCGVVVGVAPTPTPTPAPQFQHSRSQAQGDTNPQCGTKNDDVIEGTSEDDVLIGGPGDDILDGHGGNDLIYGGGGNDILIGGPGNDKVYGQDGNDVIWGDKEEGDGSARALRIAAASAPAKIGGKDLLDGGGGNDLALGGGGNDKVSGDKGKDRLWGRTGNDNINGGDNPDKLYGEEGDDFLDGGEAEDEFHPAEGDDTCVLDVRSEEKNTGGCENERRHFRRHF